MRHCRGLYAALPRYMHGTTASCNNEDLATTKIALYIGYGHISLAYYDQQKINITSYDHDILVLFIKHFEALKLNLCKPFTYILVDQSKVCDNSNNVMRTEYI